MLGDEDKNLLPGYWDKLVYAIYRVACQWKEELSFFKTGISVIKHAILSFLKTDNDRGLRSSFRGDNFSLAAAKSLPLDIHGYIG